MSLETLSFNAGETINVGMRDVSNETPDGQPTLAKCRLRTYNPSCSTFLDLVDDPLPEDWQGKQRLRLRARTRTLDPILKNNTGLIRKPSLNLQTAIHEMYNDSFPTYWPPAQDIDLHNQDAQLDCIYWLLNMPIKDEEIRKVESQRAAADNPKPEASSLKRTYSKRAGFKRKAVRILFNGRETFARPDSASDHNIITEAFAVEHGIPVQRGETDQNVFQLGNGQYVKSLGRVKVPIKVLGGNRRISNEEYQWFDVLQKCPVPLILGMGFIEKAKLWTENKHLLVDSPYVFVKIPILKWIGSPRGCIDFSANGHQLEGCADTGSDLDFMSPECAGRLGLKSDTAPSACTRVMLADESIVETIGKVHVSSIQISGFDGFDMNFHILPGLASDIIFSEEFLYQMDAFNTCVQTKNSNDHYQPRLNTLVSLGPIQTYLTRTWRPDPTDSAQQVHDNGMEAEILRRNKAKRAIRKMRTEEQAAEARRVEVLKRISFDCNHEACRYCVGLPAQSMSQSVGDLALKPTVAAGDPTNT
jgi:hypothetical protein